MSDLTLVIGDKNLSSWSLRPWLIMKQADIPFTEKLIRLDRPETTPDGLDSLFFGGRASFTKIRIPLFRPAPFSRLLKNLRLQPILRDALLRKAPQDEGVQELASP